MSACGGSSESMFQARFPVEEGLLVPFYVHGKAVGAPWAPTHLLQLQQNKTPPLIEAQGMIDRQIAQLAHLVDDLLEVSRISTGRIRVHTERMQLRGIVSLAIETIQSQADQKEQSLAVSLPDEPV